MHIGPHALIDRPEKSEQTTTRGRIAEAFYDIIKHPTARDPQSWPRKFSHLWQRASIHWTKPKLTPSLSFLTRSNRWGSSRSQPSAAKSSPFQRRFVPRLTGRMCWSVFSPKDTPCTTGLTDVGEPHGARFRAS